MKSTDALNLEYIFKPFCLQKQIYYWRNNHLVLNLRTPSTNTTWTPRTKRGRHLRTSCPKAGAMPPSEMCVCAPILPLFRGLCQPPAGSVKGPSPGSLPDFWIPRLFIFLIFFILHHLSLLSPALICHVSPTLSPSLSFVLLALLFVPPSLSAVHFSILGFFFLTWLFFVSLCSFETLQLSIFSLSIKTFHLLFLFGILIHSALSTLFPPTHFALSFSLSLSLALYSIFSLHFCPLFKACLILSSPTFQLSFWRLFNYHLSLCSAPFYKIMVPTVDTVRYHYLVKALVSTQHPVLLTGPVGTGKTSVAQNVLQSLDSVTWAMLTINMSSQVMRNTFSISNKVHFDLSRSTW